MNRLEQHALAICLSAAGLCVGLAMVLQAIGRAVELPQRGAR